MTLRDKIANMMRWYFVTDGTEGPKSRAAADCILALLAESGWRHVPDDCVVVPREPTEEMIDSGGKHVNDPTEWLVVFRVYRDMLAAAPK